MTVPCPEAGDLVDAGLRRVLTQYRESPRLLAVIASHLRQVEAAYLALCSLPDYFDIDTAVGHQLTLIGKRLGFPRCHCVCTIPAVFGFGCGGSYAGPYTIVGFCETGTWLACRETGVTEICIDDDEVYRSILKARRYQALGMYDIESLQRSAVSIWGEDASVASLDAGRVVVSPGRALTDFEQIVRPVAFRALPIAPGIKAVTTDTFGPIFGFGEGWAGFCADTGEAEAEWLCIIDPHTYDCP